MPRGQRLTTPTTCNISDLLNSIAAFVEENPLWYEDDGLMSRMAMAYGILRSISKPDEVTEEEFEFVMNLHNTLAERHGQE